MNNLKKLNSTLKVSKKKGEENKNEKNIKIENEAEKIPKKKGTKKNPEIINENVSTLENVALDDKDDGKVEQKKKVVLKKIIKKKKTTVNEKPNETEDITDVAKNKVEAVKKKILIKKKKSSVNDNRDEDGPILEAEEKNNQESVTEYSEKKEMCEWEEENAKVLNIVDSDNDILDSFLNKKSDTSLKIDENKKEPSSPMKKKKVSVKKSTKINKQKITEEEELKEEKKNQTVLESDINKIKESEFSEKINEEIKRNKIDIQTLKENSDLEILHLKKCINNLNEEVNNLNINLSDEIKQKVKLQEINTDIVNKKLKLKEEINNLENIIKESKETYNLLNDKHLILEEENKILLDKHNEDKKKIETLEEDKIKLEKKVEEKNSIIKKKEELIEKQMEEIANYKNILKTKSEMLLNSSLSDKNKLDKNIQKDYINKINQEKKELLHAFKKQLDLIIVLKKKITLLENNIILNITYNEFKKVVQD